MGAEAVERHSVPELFILVFVHERNRETEKPGTLWPWLGTIPLPEILQIRV